MTLTFKLDPDKVKVHQLAKYLDQRKDHFVAKELID